MSEDRYKLPKFKNRFVVPVFSIAFLIILTMSVGYGYWTWSTSKQAYANSTTNYPVRCVLSFENSTINLNITASSQDIDLAGGITTASGTGKVKITSGTGTSCQCTYAIKLFQESGSDTYVKSPLVGNTKEFTYAVSATTSSSVSPNSIGGNVSETNFDTCASGNLSTGCTIGTSTIGSVSSTAEVSQSYAVTIKFYNIVGINQISQMGKTYKYSLRFLPTNCNF